MSLDELQAALDGLPTERIQRLADCLETEYGVRVSVGCWGRCPLALAGFDADAGMFDMPAQRFATAWNSYALPRARVAWRKLLHRPAGKVAAHSDVQALLRIANATLAWRAASWSCPPARVRRDDAR